MKKENPRDGYTPRFTPGGEATVSGIRIRWDLKRGICTFEALPMAMMWVDSTLAGLMSGVQAMVGTARFCLALQAGGRDSVEADWCVISRFPDFPQGFAAIANIAAVAGWGQWELTSLNREAKECRFRVRNGWEGQYQKALGVCWGSAMLAGKFAGYGSRLFATNCWADQTAFLCRGDAWDEFLVYPSTRSIEKEIENLLETDEATRADMAVAVTSLKQDIARRQQAEDALRQMSQAVEQSPAAVVVTDLDANITYVNPKFTEITGYAAQEVLGRNPRILQSGTTPLEVYKELWQTIISGSTWQGEWWNKRKDGRLYLEQAAVSPIIDAQGQATHYGAVKEDITERWRIQQALRESQERFRTLVESTSDWIWEVDTQVRYTYVSPRVEQLLGYQTHEVIGRSPFELMPPEEARRVGEIFQAIAAERKPFAGLENINLHKDGRRVVVETSGVPILDRQGNLAGYRGIDRDITERKRAEEAIVEARQLYESIFQGSPEVIVLTTELEGRCLAVNPATERILGYRAEEVVGHTFEELGTYAKPSDRARLLQHVREEGMASNAEVVFRRKSGELFPALTSVVPVTVDGQRCLLGIVTDITDRKRAEERLRESQERLALALSAGGLATWDWRMDTDEIVWNDEHFRILGYAPRQVRPSFEAFLERVHPEDRPAVQARFARALEKGGDYGCECRLVWPDGTIRWMEARGHMVRDAAGQACRSYGVIMDTTQRKTAEEALRQFNAELEQRVGERTVELEHRARQLSRLASELTLAEQRERQRLARLLHDHLQQLLVGIKFGLETLVRRMDGGQRSFIEQVQSLLDESITVSRELTADLSPPILREAGLARGLDWLTRWMQDKHGLVIDLAAEEGVSPEREDVRVLLFESVRELLFNVVKHAGVTTARVELSRHDPDHIQVVVSDKGAGIRDGQPAGQRDYLLTGGFGLFSIRERLHLLDGRMEICSEPNQGTRITLIAPSGLPTPAEKKQAEPFGPPTRAAGAAEPAPPVEAVMPGRIGILLVDDHVVMRQGLSALLEAESDLAVVGQASDGQEAVELARRLRPDVILMDASMPGMDGIEATRMIHAEQPDLHIIGLSMFEENDRARAMLQAGAVNYLTKSGRPEVLLSAIRQQKERRE